MSFYQENFMLQIDQRIDEARIRQFADEVQHISPRLLHFLQESLVFDKEADFYHGQLAALQFAHQLAKAANAPHAMTLGCTIAVIAKHIVDNELWIT